MRERILAVLGAVCLVAVGVLVRQALAGDDGDDGGSTGRGRRPVVACEPDLATVCRALVADGEITAADPPTLALTDAAEPPEDVDAWITWDPASQIADFRAGSASEGPWDTARAVAGARTAVLTTPEVEQALRDACQGGPVTWACVAEVADDQRPLGVGAADTAEGLARVLPVATVLSEDLDPQTLDVGRLEDLLDTPVSGQGTTAEQTERLVRFGPAEVAMVVGPVEALRDAAATSQGRSRDLQVVIPEPLAKVSVVVAPRRGATLGDLIAQVRQDRSKDALFALGLDAPGSASGEDVAGFLFQVSKKVG